MIKVLFVVEQFEHERGYGIRPEGFVCFLTEALATAYITAELAARVPGPVPDTYWSNNPIGYREACSERLQSAGRSGRVYVDRVNDLLTPGPTT